MGRDGSPRPGLALGQRLPRSGAGAADWRRNARRWFWGYFFAAPSIVCFLVFGLYPMLSNILLSFQRFSLFGNEWVGLGNYQEMLADTTFQRSLVNTLLYLLGIVPLTVVISLVIGVLIYQEVPLVQTLLKASYYMPSIASGVVLSLIWLYLYDPAYGPLTYLVERAGGPKVLWLADPDIALWSLVFMAHALGHGATIILIVAALGAIPDQLYEAAEIDGAGRLQQMVRITVPLLRPVLAYITIMGTIQTLQIFTQPYVMTRGGPNWSTSTLSYYIYNQGFVEMMHWGIGASAAVLMLVLTLALALVQFRFFASDVEY